MESRELKFKQSQAIEDIEHWLWSTQREISYLREVLIPEEIMNTLLYFGSLPSVENRKISSHTEAHIHYLLIALNHLNKSLGRGLVPKAIKLQKFPDNVSDVAKKLRHIREHWDQQREQFEMNLTRTGSAVLYNNYPNATPWSLSLDDKGLLIGGILNLDNVSSHLTLIEKSIDEYRGKVK
jgi:hypothetical protein